MFGGIISAVSAKTIDFIYDVASDEEKEQSQFELTLFSEYRAVNIGKFTI